MVNLRKLITPLGCVPTFALLVTGLAPSVLSAEEDSPEVKITTLELAPGLEVPLAEPKPIDWDTVSPSRLLKLFLDQLRSDPSDEFEYRLKVMRQLVEHGDFEFAKEVVEGLGQANKSEALAELACLMIEFGRIEDGTRTLNEANAWRVHAQELHQESARRFLAIGYGRIGEGEKSEEMLRGIKYPIYRESARGALLSPESEPEEISEFLALTDEPAVLPQIDLLVRLADEKLAGGETEAALKLLDDAGQRAFKMGKVTSYARVAEIVKVLLKHGEHSEAEVHLASFVRGIRQMANEMDEKGVSLAKAAIFAMEIGKMAMAEELLTEAEDKIKHVFVLYAAGPLAAIAEAWVKMGKPERAMQLIEIAAKTSAAYDHVRGKAMGAVWVCLFCHVTGLSMEPEIREQMRRAAGG